MKNILIISILILSGCTVSQEYQKNYENYYQAVSSQKKNDLLKLELHENGTIKSISIGDLNRKQISPPQYIVHPAWDILKASIMTAVPILGGVWQSKIFGDSMTDILQAGKGNSNIEYNNSYNQNTEKQDYNANIKNDNSIRSKTDISDNSSRTKNIDSSDNSSVSSENNSINSSYNPSEIMTETNDINTEYPTIFKETE